MTTLTHPRHFVAFFALTLTLGHAMPAIADSPVGLVDWQLVEPQPAPEDCISAAERQRADQAILEYQMADGGHPSPETGAPPKYLFLPQAGNLWQDLIVNNYVDVNPSGAIVAFECTDWAYNGHNGHDIDIRDFGHQDLGVPIFAPLDGTVVYAVDGHPDRNTSCVGDANAVIIDHGNGRFGWYWHMKNGSVAVSVGNTVVAGQQIGLTASSGCSTNPHLHFETQDNNVAFEPYAGPCRAGDSGWVNQPPIVTTTYFNDFGVTHLHPNTSPWPNPWPRSAQMAFTDSVLYVWVTGHYLPINSTIRTRFIRPNGTQEYDSGNQNFNNGVRYRHVVFWQGWNIPAMRTIAGVWQIEISINGVVQVTAPVTVVPTRDPAFNRPPEPISVAFDPVAPTADEAIFCRVSGSLTLDDLDWDIVRYRYEWTADGATISDVTTAARSDAIPRNAAAPGDLLVCSVTASDGRGGSAAPAAVSITLPGGYDVADTNCDGIVNFFDIAPFLLALFDPPAYDAAHPDCDVSSADINGDTQVNFFDIDPFVVCVFGGPCP